MSVLICTPCTVSNEHLVRFKEGLMCPHSSGQPFFVAKNDRGQGTDP